MRFDYLGRVLTIKPRLTPTEKGKLPQTNSQSKQAIFGSSYDKNRPEQFLIEITRKEIILVSICLQQSVIDAIRKGKDPNL
jgi:hypothetical protein